MDSLAKVFGINPARYVEMIDGLALTSITTDYSFTAKEEFDQILHNDPIQEEIGKK